MVREFSVDSVTYKDVGGYGYLDFLNWLYDYIMVENLEFTNKYSLMPRSRLEGSLSKAMLEYSRVNRLLWVLGISGSDTVYIEVIDNRVSKDLVSLYAYNYAKGSDNLKGDGEFDSLVSDTVVDLNKVYYENIATFISSIGLLLTTRDELHPFCITSLADSSSLTFGGGLVLAFRVSFSDALALLESVNSRFIGVWEGREITSLLSKSSESPLVDVVADRLGRGLFVKGIHLKRENVKVDTVRDASLGDFQG